ncbi:hypothetical protein E1H18_1302 [Caulobacter sp. RHG1]|nr:hypothetical protein [Caulobacter sp. RHG1]
MAERENMVGNAAAIGMVAFNRKFGTMMQQAVKDVGCLARTGGNNLGMKRRIAIRDVSIEGYRRFTALVGINRTGRLRAAIKWKVLAIGTRHISIAEHI